jgi:hypothetical protein
MSDLEEITKAVIFPLIKLVNRNGVETQILVAYEYERHISHNTPLDETVAGPLKAIRIKEYDKKTKNHRYTIWVRADYIELELNIFKYPEIEYLHILSWDDPQLTEKIEQNIKIEHFHISKE